MSTCSRSLSRSIAAAWILVCLFALPLHAATITIINIDGENEGLNDPTPVAPVGGNMGTTLGQQRMLAAQFAADIWSSLLVSDVEIRVEFQFDPLGGEATGALLATARPKKTHLDFAGAPLAGTVYASALADSLAQVDLDPMGNDIASTANSDVDGDVVLGTTRFYYGFDRDNGDNADFISTFLHELGHGLGFTSFIDSETGAKPTATTGTGDTLELEGSYMVHLIHRGATPEDFPSMTDAQRLTAITAGPDLRWNGPRVKAASARLTDGASPAGDVEIFAPAPLQAGSSLTHFSEALSPDELMEPSTKDPIHDVGLTLELFQDLGWRTQEVRTPIVIATIPVGDGPSFPGVNPTTNRVYVPNKVGDTISVIDGLTNAVVTTIPLSPCTHHPAGCAPGSIGVNPTTNRMYIAGVLDDTFFVIDGATDTIVASNIPVGDAPEVAAVNPFTNRVYITICVSPGCGVIPGRVVVIDGVSNAIITTVDVGQLPIGVAVDPTTNRVYTADFNSNTVSVIDGASDMVIATVPVDSGPIDLGVNPVTNRIYVANRSSDTVSVIDWVSNTVIATVDVGDGPSALGVHPTANRVYVANFDANTVSIIDGASNMVIATVPVGNGPAGVGVNPFTDRIYVTNQFDNTLSVISDEDTIPPAADCICEDGGGGDATFTWSHVFNTRECTIDAINGRTVGLRLVNMEGTSSLETTPRYDIGTWRCRVTSNVNEITRENELFRLDKGQAEACFASLRAIAVRDGVTCQ